MSVKLRPINFNGNYVREDSPHKVGYAAYTWKCDGCGCGKETGDFYAWGCPCSCHDGWKFLADGGRYRDQLASGIAGRSTRDLHGVDGSSRSDSIS